MVGSMADLLLLTLLTAVILILLTTFIGILILPFLNASNQDVRDLFLAVKDLALPMGSFPSKLLRHESSKAMLQVIPTELNPQENHNVIKDVIIQKTPMEISAGEDSRLISTPSQQSNDEPAAQITPPSVTPGNTDENTERVISDLSEMVKEKETLEAYIRQMADPGDSRGLAAMSLSSLIPWVMQQNERNMRNLRMENNEREDEIYSARQAFEAVIIGQNVAMREMDHERGVAREQASELRVENWHLCGGSKKAEMSDESTIEELRRRAKRAEGTAQEARAFADQTTTGVEDRIRKLKATHAQAMADAAFQNLQERNSLICSRRMVHDNLIDARHQIDEQKQQHQDAMRERNTVIKELDAMNKRLRLTAAASEQLAASVEERLQKQLDDQRKTATELQQTITNLESGQKVKELTDGLLRQVEAAKNNEQEVRTRVQSLEEERVRVAEQHQNAINEKDRKIQNLEQTVGENNSRLEHQVRVEVARQVEAAKDNEQEARTQVQTLEEEKVRIAEQHQNAINEKDRKIQNLEQTVGENNSRLEHQVGVRVEVARQVEAAKNNEQEARTQVQTLEEEKVRIAEQHQNAINEKDRKIQNLEQTVGENNSRLEHQVGVEVARRLKMAVDAKEVDVWNEAVQQDGDSNMEHEEGDTSAAKEAKKRFQVHLGSERRTMVGKLSEATETGNKLRAEVGDLKSQIERNKVAAELADTKKTESEPADNKKESSSTAGEMDEANSILEEIGEQGIPRICGERLLLNELNKAKRTLASVKHEVQQPEPDKNDLLYAISEASIDEGRFQQCDFRKRPVLLRQARAANEKLYALQRLLNTDSEVQKDAVLGILQSPGKNQTMALADETGAHGRSAEFATVNARQGQDDLIMGEASEIQNNIMPEASETGNPPRSLADILDTLRSSE